MPGSERLDKDISDSRLKIATDLGLIADPRGLFYVRQI
jgi:hypothetical protein